jgi:hypothetical protein
MESLVRLSVTLQFNMARRQHCVARFSIIEREPLSLRSFFVTSSDLILMVSSKLLSVQDHLSTQTCRQQFDPHETVSGINFLFIPRWKPLY